ncbi:hypothetical protein [Nonomuraea sp. NPDC049158]|uniref:hypothetical protein n=1 Tax=Nonomuraea sp. NPDC049158 TaxID=3155649 RepID=UPI0033F7FA4C
MGIGHGPFDFPYGLLDLGLRLCQACTEDWLLVHVAVLDPMLLLPSLDAFLKDGGEAEVVAAAWIGSVVGRRSSVADADLLSRGPAVAGADSAIGTANPAAMTTPAANTQTRYGRTGRSRLPEGGLRRSPAACLV